MRQLKFKAFNKSEKRWIDIFSLHCDDGHIQSIEDATGKRFNISDVELVEFTGMKDKNGKEIYERDIVEWFDSFRRMNMKKGVSQILWQQLGFNIEGSDFGYEGEDLIGWDNLNVIGNIYENPELLAGSV